MSRDIDTRQVLTTLLSFNCLGSETLIKLASTSKEFNKKYKPLIKSCGAFSMGFSSEFLKNLKNLAQKDGVIDNTKWNEKRFTSLLSKIERFPLIVPTITPRELKNFYYYPQPSRMVKAVLMLYYLAERVRFPGPDSKAFLDKLGEELRSCYTIVNERIDALDSETKKGHKTEIKFLKALLDFAGQLIRTNNGNETIPPLDYQKVKDKYLKARADHLARSKAPKSVEVENRYLNLNSKFIFGLYSAGPNWSQFFHDSGLDWYSQILSQTIAELKDDSLASHYLHDLERSLISAKRENIAQRPMLEIISHFIPYIESSYTRIVESKPTPGDKIAFMGILQTKFFWIATEMNSLRMDDLGKLNEAIRVSRLVDDTISAISLDNLKLYFLILHILNEHIVRGCHGMPSILVKTTSLGEFVRNLLRGLCKSSLPFLDIKNAAGNFFKLEPSRGPFVAKTISNYYREFKNLEWLPIICIALINAAYRDQILGINTLEFILEKKKFNYKVEPGVLIDFLRYYDGSVASVALSTFYPQLFNKHLFTDPIYYSEHTVIEYFYERERSLTYGGFSRLKQFEDVFGAYNNDELRDASSLFRDKLGPNSAEMNSHLKLFLFHVILFARKAYPDDMWKDFCAKLEYSNTLERNLSKFTNIHFIHSRKYYGPISSIGAIAYDSIIQIGTILSVTRFLKKDINEKELKQAINRVNEHRQMLFDIKDISIELLLKVLAYFPHDLMMGTNEFFLSIYQMLLPQHPDFIPGIDGKLLVMMIEENLKVYENKNFLMDCLTGVHALFKKRQDPEKINTTLKIICDEHVDLSQFSNIFADGGFTEKAKKGYYKKKRGEYEHNYDDNAAKLAPESKLTNNPSSDQNSTISVSGNLNSLMTDRKRKAGDNPDSNKRVKMMME